jgi:ferrochelatase
VETVLERWAGEGVGHIVLAPVAFVNEHSETLYELDVLYQGMARKLGMSVDRLPTLGTEPAFIEGLAGRVRRAAESPGSSP